MQSRFPITLILIFLTAVVFAHPEDEFCTPGEDSLDPELCAALAELDSQQGRFQNSDDRVVQLGNDRGALATGTLYIAIGIRHILPGGLDHILFVLAIFFASTKMRSLVIQISAFTIAHTVTLALAATGAITPNPEIVEPLIAITIVFVAVENLIFRKMTRWRPAVVFGFGLIHGLGFAGFFGSLGLPPGHFWSALIGFNIGVEMGQLFVVALALTVVHLMQRRFSVVNATRHYQRYVAMPGSMIIGLIGLYWVFERLTQ